METGRFSELTRSDPTVAPGAASAGQWSVRLASLGLRRGRRAGLLVSSESLFPTFPFPFFILASYSNSVLSFLPRLSPCLPKAV